MPKYPKDDPNLPEDFQEPRPFNPVAWWVSIGLLCAVILASSIFVTGAYRNRRIYEAENYRPPYMFKLETDLKATNRDGEKISFNDDLFKKKVFVAGYQYTDCPAGCLGMAALMKDLHETFSEKYPHFQLVSISVNPAGDSPEKMNAWVKDKGIDTENWWFLTGDEKQIKSYMRDEFKMLETQEITDPAIVVAEGPLAHDQRLVIVDEFSNIRGFYRVMNPQVGAKEYERLKYDLEFVLEDFDPDDPSKQKLPSK
ncbi:MAG: hypothetical protein HKN23_12835 [Verrucomicrobiales bacterium]|nr:hypothetical protein [Verrucomicrobiales bacterium]